MSLAVAGLADGAWKTKERKVLTTDWHGNRKKDDEKILPQQISNSNSANIDRVGFKLGLYRIMF